MEFNHHDDARCTYCKESAITYTYPDDLPTPVCGAHSIELGAAA
ncbi:hypothetical protein NOGI109294_15370 [Nocardiopsis gilva]|nr:hypothetical protein [Nocardiopsis gilva]